MKILHVCPVYHPAVGGVENVFKAVSENLVRKGEDVSVFTTTAPTLEAFFNPWVKPLKAGEEIIHGVTVRRFPYRRIVRFPARLVSRVWQKFRLPFQDDFNAWSALPWLATDITSEIMRFKPDVILAGHFLTRTVQDVYKAKAELDMPLVYIPCLHLGRNEPPSDLSISLLKKAEAVWAVTSFEKEFLLDKGLSKEKVFDFGVGVDVDAFKDADGGRFRRLHHLRDEPLILFVGRKEKEKGVGTLMEALTGVQKHHPKVKLVLAGSSTKYFRSLFEKFRRQGDGGSLISIDQFSDEEKKDLFSACNIFVLPSKIESFGMVYLEAWISGKPVIGANIGSTRSLIDEGTNGYLIGFGDVESLAKRIIDLLDHPHKAKAMGELGREKVLKQYTWNHVTDKLWDLYRNLISC